jgi:hypothetical protein
MDDREFWMQFREATLHILDIVERRLNIRPSTSELRKAARLSNK